MRIELLAGLGLLVVIVITIACTRKKTESRADLGTGNVAEAADERRVSEQAVRLHEEGRVAGSDGRHDEAIKLFEKAMAVAPTWPYPPYDLAFTHLLRGDVDNALEYYRKTDELAPDGFFTTKTAIQALEGESSGRFPKGTYLKYLSLEWTRDTKEQDRILTDILAAAPQFAPAMKERALAMKDPQQKVTAFDEALASDPDVETLIVLVSNRAIALAQLGRKDEAVASLKKLLSDPSFKSPSMAMVKATLESIEAQ